MAPTKRKRRRIATTVLLPRYCVMLHCFGRHLTSLVIQFPINRAQNELYTESSLAGLSLYVRRWHTKGIDGSYPLLSADWTLINDLVRPWLIFSFSSFRFFFSLQYSLIVWFSSDASPCQDSAALLQRIINRKWRSQRTAQWIEPATNGKKKVRPLKKNNKTWRVARNLLLKRWWKNLVKENKDFWFSRLPLFSLLPPKSMSILWSLRAVRRGGKFIHFQWVVKNKSTLGSARRHWWWHSSIVGGAL